MRARDPGPWRHGLHLGPPAPSLLQAGALDRVIRPLRRGPPRGDRTSASRWLITEWERWQRRGRTDDGIPADARVHPPTCGDALRAQGDRHPQTGQDDPTVHIRGLHTPREEARGRAPTARPAAGRPRRDVVLEPVRAPRGVLRNT